MRRALQATILLLLACTPALAHIGSPDTFIQTQAGPYKLLLAAHPPAVTPGSIEVDLRFDPADHLTTALATLDGAQNTPVNLFADGTATVGLWAATPNAHTLQVTVQGARGPGIFTVQLPAQAAQPQPNTRKLHPVLAMLGFLTFIAATFAQRRSRNLGIVLFIAAALILAAVLFVRFRPEPAIRVITSISVSSDGRLDLSFANSAESFADLIPDHGQLMHLFLIRAPQRDVLLHLHPQQTATGRFSVQLPAMPPGTYTLFADLYHRDARGNVRNETPTTTLTLPAQSRTPLSGPDDSFGNLPPLSHPNGTSTTDTGGNHLYTSRLPDGYFISLATAPSLEPLQAAILTATLLDPSGKPPADTALYLGMNAHAVILRTGSPDAAHTVFAHIHPGSTLPMLTSATNPMAGMTMPQDPVSNVAAIPYGFPAAGQYRVFVQMKHGHTVETAAFDVAVK